MNKMMQSNILVNGTSGVMVQKTERINTTWVSISFTTVSKLPRTDLNMQIEALTLGTTTMYDAMAV
jgi:hypothetical protein